MFKLFFANEKNISDKLATLQKSSNNQKGDKLYIDFNVQLIKFINYHMKIFSNDDNKNKKNMNKDEYLLSFIIKVISILEINKRVNSKLENYEFVYMNIANYIQKNDNDNEKSIINILFFNVYSTIHIEDIESKDKKDLITQLSDIIHSISKYYKGENNFYEVLYSIFIKDFIHQYIKFLSEEDNTITSLNFMINFIPYYNKILKRIYVEYFSGFHLVNKTSNFISKIISSTIEIFPFKPNDSFPETELISKILSNKEYSLLLEIMSLVSQSKELLHYYIVCLLKGLSISLSTELNKSKNEVEKFFLIKEKEQLFFNNHNRNFFLSSIENFSVIEEYQKVIYDILCKENSNINENFVRAFDLIMRDNSQESQDNLKIIFSYFNIIPQYESFEWMYIHSIINRAVDEVFDFIKEKSMIEQIEVYSKEKNAYSYRLQTLINNIKMARSNELSLIVFPFHSYHLFNSNCKPNYHPYLISKFKKFLIDNKFPENSNLIFQQGYIQFISKKNVLKDIVIKGDIIQFSILCHIGESKRDFDAIKNEIGISEEMTRFLLKEMANKEIIEMDEEKDEYWINKNSLGGKEVDIRVNYEMFFEGGGDYTKYRRKMTQKYQAMVWDCYIVKFLKKNHQRKKGITTEEIYQNLEETLPETAKTFLSEETFQNSLKVLTTRGLILQITSNIYKYI